MPNPAIIQLCDLLVAFLNAGQFSQAFEAKRTYAPVVERDTVGTEVLVLVAPPATTLDLESRGSWSQTYTVQAGVYAACNADDADRIDDLILFIDELIEAVEDLDVFSLVRIENNPMYDASLLLDQSVFMSVLTFTYQARRLKRA